MAEGDVVTGGAPTGGAGEVTMAGSGVVTRGVPTGGGRGLRAWFVLLWNIYVTRLIVVNTSICLVTI